MGWGREDGRRGAWLGGGRGYREVMSAGGKGGGWVGSRKAKAAECNFWAGDWRLVSKDIRLMVGGVVNDCETSWMSALLEVGEAPARGVVGKWGG